MKEFLRKSWKIILIILLCILFLGTCAKKNNYRRKLNIEYNTSVLYNDSVAKVINYHVYRFDSVCKVNDGLRNDIDKLNKEIENLNKDIEIYKDQNRRLHNKKINVIINEVKPDSETKIEE